VTAVQRRRGLPAKIWKVEDQEDSRGNIHKVAVPNDPYIITIWVYPQRSARAEVPGQQRINVVRIGVPGHIQGLDLWTRLEFQDRQWDVVTPPSYHHGTRHTRHWSIDVRERPSGAP
jgi:hypothetical protein